MRTTIAFIAFVVIAAAPSSASAVTRLVDDDKTQCPSAPFTTVQAAVDVAQPNDLVLICTGVYNESVEVFGAGKNGVRLRSHQPHTAVIRSDAQDATVFIRQAANVFLERLRLESAAGSPCTGASWDAVLAIEAHGLRLLENRIFAGPQTDPDCGSPLLHGAEIGTSLDVLVRDNTIRGYQGSGVALSGVDTSAVVMNNDITAGFSGGQAQYGVEVRDGARARILGNRVFDNVGAFTGIDDPPSGGGGIYLASAAEDLLVEVAGNHAARNIVGIRVATLEANIHDNTATNNLAERGFFGNGVLVEPGTQGNRFQRNNFRGNAGTDCMDVTGGSHPQAGYARYTTQNFWINNKGFEASPFGICTPNGARA